MSSIESMATPTLPTSPCAIGRVGVVAHLGGQVEGDGQARRAVRDQLLVAGVGLGGRAEAGVLAHRPRAAGVHRRVDAAGEGVRARLAQLLGRVPAGQGVRPVHRLDGQSRLRLARHGVPCLLVAIDLPAVSPVRAVCHSMLRGSAHGSPGQHCSGDEPVQSGDPCTGDRRPHRSSPRPRAADTRGAAAGGETVTLDGQRHPERSRVRAPARRRGTAAPRRPRHARSRTSPHAPRGRRHRPAAAAPHPACAAKPRSPPRRGAARGRRGASGEQVRELQARLRQIGHFGRTDRLLRHGDARGGQRLPGQARACRAPGTDGQPHLAAARCG